MGRRITRRPSLPAIAGGTAKPLRFFWQPLGLNVMFQINFVAND